MLNSRLIPICAAVAAVVSSALGEDKPPFPLIDIKLVDPTIVVDLRYAGPNNITGHALYPQGTSAMIRPELMVRLSAAQKYLRRYDYRLKIWDAYRPKAVQEALWQASQNNRYVADPNVGAGSLHSWGIAVDATLADIWKRPVSMPTDFDDFTPAALWWYQGLDPAIRSHLHLLQIAMRDAGFYGLRSEWWHFTIANWQRYLPPEEAKRAEEALATQEQGTL